MIKYLLILVLIILIIIFICKLNDNNEEYKISCPECDPDDADIRGNNVIECVRRCSNSDINCKKDSECNDIDIIPLANDYLSKYPNIQIEVPRPSDESNIKLQDQSSCLKKCLQCGWSNDGDNCKCSWSPKCQKLLADSYNDFKIKWNSKQFTIGAIPDDKKITLSWNENLIESDINNYILYIFQKNNIRQVLTKKITHMDIIKNQNNNIYIIDNLLNNVQYGIQLNKISKLFSDKPKLVKTSNTIYAVPSEINLLNFSNINNSKKECDSLAENLLDNFVGREFEINLG